MADIETLRARLRRAQQSMDSFYRAKEKEYREQVGHGRRTGFGPQAVGYGPQTVSPSDVENYIMGTGGNPYESAYLAALRAVEGAGGGGQKRGSQPARQGPLPTQRVGMPYQPYFPQQPYGGQPAPYGQPMMNPQQMMQMQLAGSYAQQMAEANRQNELRYEQLLGGSTNLRDRALEEITGLGQYQRDDTNERYDKLRNASYAGAAARGLTGTTVPSSLAQSIEEERGQSLRRVEDDIARRRVGADVDLTNNVLGYIERRQDVQPDLNQLVALQQGLGASGGGMGYGGFGQPNFGGYQHPSFQQGQGMGGMGYGGFGMPGNQYAGGYNAPGGYLVGNPGMLSGQQQFNQRRQSRGRYYGGMMNRPKAPGVPVSAPIGYGSYASPYGQGMPQQFDYYRR